MIEAIPESVLKQEFIKLKTEIVSISTRYIQIFDRYLDRLISYEDYLDNDTYNKLAKIRNCYSFQQIRYYFNNSTYYNQDTL